jgi:hypothetical protein
VRQALRQTDVDLGQGVPDQDVGRRGIGYQPHHHEHDHCHDRHCGNAVDHGTPEERLDRVEAREID